MAYSEKVIDHYNNPRNVGQLDKSIDGGRYGSGGRAGVRRRDALADSRQPRDAGHRRGQVQDLWLRLGDCQFFAGHRVDQRAAPWTTRWASRTPTS